MAHSHTQMRAETLLISSSSHALPVILQTEAAECGLACLAMVAGFHGFDTDLSSIRRRFPLSAHGATLKQIMDIANKMAFSTRALKLDLAHLEQLQTPCILHWEMKHFVVLKKISGKKVVIHDPAMGERSLTLDEVDRLFTGVALELSPTSSFEQGKDKQQLKISHFWSRIVGLKRSLGVILLLSFFLQLFAIVSPYYMQTVIDDVILRSDLNLLTVLAIGFGLLLVLEAGIGALRELVILHLSSRMNIQMASNIFRHLIRLPMEYFARRHMGDVVSRFGSLNQIRELMTTGLVAVVIDGIMASLMLIVMFMYSVKLTFIVLLVVFLYAILRVLFYPPIRRLNEERIVAQAKESSHFMESVRAVQTIKLFEKESERQNQWQNKLAEAMNKEIRIGKWQISFDTANKLLFGFENIIIVYFAALAVTQSLLSVGMLYAFVSYKTRFVSSMDNLISKWIEFKMLSLHFDRLADIVFTPQDFHISVQHDLRAVNSPLERQAIKGEIQVEDLQFAYSKLDSPIFSNLNFTIEAGQTVAIVGQSGGGKTTLLKCLMGLLLPDQGRISIDGTPLANIEHYRQSIAGVMQDDQLLSGSIAENIACFASTIDMQRAVYCAHLACIHEEIMATNMHYNTLTGDMGTSLSSGQRQRIILARALYKQPAILFMDEATSHLDIDNEKAINSHIKKLSITRVIIAHRPQTIAMADRVFKLDSGRLTEITNAVKQP